MGISIPLYWTMSHAHTCAAWSEPSNGPGFDHAKAPSKQPAGLHGRVTEVFELVSLSLSQRMLLITITSKSYHSPTFDPSSVIDGRKRAGGLSRDQPVPHTCFVGRCSPLLNLNVIKMTKQIVLQCIPSMMSLMNRAYSHRLSPLEAGLYTHDPETKSLYSQRPRNISRFR
jgi:hypothetical protein